MHFMYNNTISLLLSQPWVSIPAFDLVGCVAEGKCPNLSEPLFCFFCLLTVKRVLECPLPQKSCSGSGGGELKVETSVESPVQPLLQKVLHRHYHHCNNCTEWEFPSWLSANEPD